MTKYIPFLLLPLLLAISCKTGQVIAPVPVQYDPAYVQPDFADYIKVDNSIIPKSFGRVLLCFAEFQKEWLIERMNEKYKVVIKDEVWYDESNLLELEGDYNVHLKMANKKCYIIPLQK